MSTDNDYEYLAEISKAKKETVDRPSGLWRRRGDQLEYLSLVDWSWHPRGDVYVPHPDLLVPISTEQVQTLLADRQRFARYWVEYLSPEKATSTRTRTGNFRVPRVSSMRASAAPTPGFGHRPSGTSRLPALTTVPTWNPSTARPPNA